jgi:uncharacterized protein YggE
MNCPYSNYHSLKKGEMSVEGKGSLEVQPDLAYVTLGVISEGKDLKMVQRENAIKISEVISAVERAGVSKKNIKTQEYTVEPQYNYIDGKEIFMGYKVSNILSLKVENLMDLGQIIDAAVESGANSVRSINFNVSDEGKYYTKALNLAAESAVTKALSLEQSLKIRVNPTPINIVEEGRNAVVLGSTMLKASSFNTPILAGPLKITAEIKALFSYFIY